MSPNNQILKLKEYILGELSAESMQLLEDICLKDENLLKKLTLKCQKNAIYIKAKDFDLIVKSLKFQTNLSGYLLQTIHYHLQDKNTESLANVLITLGNKLEKELPAIDTLQSILTVINSLQVFTNLNSEEKFIRSIVVLMLNFHTKQHNNNHNNYQDSAKWLKSLLSISEKSSLIQLIDYIAIRLSIAKTSLSGDENNIELTEIFFILEEIATAAELNCCDNSNTGLIKNINACILISIVCNKNPHAFVDVVAHQLEDEKTNLVLLTRDYINANSQLVSFASTNNYQLYYKTAEKLKNINFQALLMCFSNSLHEELISKFNEYFPEAQLIKNIITAFNTEAENMSDEEFRNYINKLTIEPRIVDAFISNILPSIIVKLKDSLKYTSSLNYAANKLVTLGFAPRANTYSSIGMFAPIISKDKFQKDYKNIRAIYKYINTLEPKNKALLVKELLISLLVRYRANPYKLENQPKPITKQADKRYQSLINQYARHYNVNDKKPITNNSYQLTFFTRKITSNKQKLSASKIHPQEIENNVMIR